MPVTRTPGRISLPAARRIALAAQGFGAPRPPGVAWRQLARILDRLALHQIDSVNVLARAHYLPSFSRLGPYDRALIDRAAWGPRSERRLFEYWAHEASLLPLALHPLLRWRMARAESGAPRPEAQAVLDRIKGEGPMAASDFAHGGSRGGWWEWGDTKRALEWLFRSGRLTTATRRASFERVYDLSERVIPGAILALPTPTEAEARRRLVEISARALGVATQGDLRDYFRLKPDEAKAAIEALVEDGILLPVRVESWRQDAFLHAEARRPRRIHALALLAPFDPLIWHRDRAERLFGFRYRIEIYTPAEKRVHGYYVLPFLMDERLVARVDLKADRQRGRLLVRSVHFEPGAPRDTAERLAAELSPMAQWLGLEAVEGLVG